MEKRTITLDSELTIDVYNPTADQAIIICHGASEGKSRYQKLATDLAENSAVITYNHPGHETGLAVELGDVDNVTKTTLEVIEYAKCTYRSVTIFAHSMGTLVVRCLLKQLDSDIKLILSGAPMTTTSDRIGLKLVIKGRKLLSGERLNERLNYMLFDQKNDRVGLKNKTWLTHDQAVIDEYKHNPLQGQRFTNPSIITLARLTLKATSKATSQQFNKFSSVMLVAGIDDAFCSGGKMYNQISVHCKQPEVHIYPNSHHEIHNDIDRNQLIKDIKAFINKGAN